MVSASPGDDELMLSIVMPCYTEEDVSAETQLRLSTTLDELGTNLEFIYVDDGSIDSTMSIIRDVAA